MRCPRIRISRGVIVALSWNAACSRGECATEASARARFSLRSRRRRNFMHGASSRRRSSPSGLCRQVRGTPWPARRAVDRTARSCRTSPLACARCRSDVVLDHIAGVSSAISCRHRWLRAGFRCLLSLVESRHVWVKLCAYRPACLPSPTTERGRPFSRCTAEGEPERLLWGSDWPHLRVQPPPDAASLLEVFQRWTDSERLIDQILVTNPIAAVRLTRRQVAWLFELCARDLDHLLPLWPIRSSTRLPPRRLSPLGDDAVADEIVLGPRTLREPALISRLSRSTISFGVPLRTLM